MDVNMKKQTLIWCGLALISLLWLSACGGDGGAGGSGTDNTTNSVNQSNAPTSLAGKTFHFTTTSSQSFSEPVGSTFSVTFTDDSHFSYTPSAQNPDGRGPFIGTYTYDPNTSTAVFSQGTLPETTVIFSLTGPGTGTVHMSHPDGGTLDAAFTES
jgi:hypothetical protein